MENVISHSGVAMPPMLYGTAWKKEHTAENVIAAVHAGFRGIDTACQPKHYHEEGVGEALLALYDEGFTRDDLFLQTKFTPLAGQDPQRIPYDPNADLATQVQQSVERSLQNLHTDTIDSLVLHSPLFPYKELQTVWHTMQSFVDKNVVRQIGISNCYDLGTLKRLFEEDGARPAVVQNRFYEQSDYDKEIRTWCLDNNVIYQSFWTLTANPHLLGSKAIIKAAMAHKKTPVQVMYRYMSQIGAIPLNGTTDPQHMREDLESFSFTLEQKELQNITALLD
jgi:diketogulonate reductase-like aldo/keto reductase